MKKNTFSMGLVLAIGLVGPVNAAPVVSVSKDHSLRISLRGQASTVVAANPMIADVNVVDSHTVFILGRGIGSSQVTIIDAQGRSLWSGDVRVSQPHADTVVLHRGTKASLAVCQVTCEESGMDAGGSGTGGAPTGVSPMPSGPTLAPIGSNGIAPQGGFNTGGVRLSGPGMFGPG